MHPAMDAVSHSLGGHDKPKKEIKEIRTRKAASGGHIHEHHHTRPDVHPMEEHTTSGDDAMAEHMMQNMGQANPGEQEADPNAAAAAGGASAAPAAVPGA